MNRHVWCGGETGRLQILRCGDCARWIHPYAACCPACGSAAVSPQPVSGRGVVVSYTINHQAWGQEAAEPYLIALVALHEQSDIRLLSNLPGCPPDEVRIGLEVEVVFEPRGDVLLPQFRRS